MNTTGWRWWARRGLMAVALAATSAVAQAGIGDGSVQRGVTASANALAALGSGLDGTLSRLGGGLDDLLTPLDATHLDPLDGAVSFETAIEYQGVGRRIIYVRPPNEPRADVPAIVLLHYSLSTPERMINVTRAEKLAAKFGVWVILPEATNRHWPADPLNQDVSDEVGFISAVIRDATRRYPVDPDRVYLAGLSNGGHMVNRYICENTRLIAGAAVVAASLNRVRSGQCATRTPLPMLLIVGTFDPFVPYNGSIKLLSAADTFEYWRARNGCNAAQTRTVNLAPGVDDGSTVRRKQNTDCRYGATVRQFSVVHGGHAWPGGKIQIESLGRFSPTSRNLDATLQLWYFFSQFKRR